VNANALRWDGRPGRYEVWYLTVAGRFWIRYSLRVPADPDDDGEAALWLADITGTPHARKATFPLEALRAARDGWPLELGPGLLGDTEASGEIDGARWRLTFSAAQRPFVYTPPVMSRLGLASTEVVVAKPSLAVSGFVELGGERHELDAAPGQQAHLFGRRHAAPPADRVARERARCRERASRDPAHTRGARAGPRARRAVPRRGSARRLRRSHVRRS
jgi:hypothetical protein